jgi:protein-histidine N-methyltransferase
MASDEDIRVFKEWLLSNGAKFEKIDWPSNETVSGIRGAVARDDINCNEVMVTIPAQLMMSPPNAFASPIGCYLNENKDILKNDTQLTLYIMYERSKGESSFYHPFLRILPQPGSIAHWSDSELSELQDEALHVRAKGRAVLVEVRRCDECGKQITRTLLQYPSFYVIS